MKEKIVKSYVLFGNLPIYSRDDSAGEPGITKPSGCDFVINSRLKYELGICSFQFIKQVHPSVYNIENSNFNPTVELDISSLVRLKIFIKMWLDKDINITKESTQFIHLTSTKIQKSLEYQKSVFAQIDDNLKFIIDDKKQEVFEIFGIYQIQCFFELVCNILEHLQTAYINYDINKHHRAGQSVGVNSTVAAPPITKYASHVPPPVPTSRPLPEPVTTQVIPQAPKI